MLQRGFLKSQENNSASKNNKKFIMLAGAVLFILGGALTMQQGRLTYICLALIIIGSILVSASLWMDFFERIKKRNIK